MATLLWQHRAPSAVIAERVADLRAIPAWQFDPVDRQRAELARNDLILRALRGEAIRAYVTTPGGRWAILLGDDPRAHDPLDCTTRYLATHSYHGSVRDLAAQAATQTTEGEAR